MSVRTIAPTRGLKGEVTIPGDKSISHRSIMLGSIALGTTEITHFLEGADCLSTIDCFRKMGVEIERKPSSILVHGKGLRGLTAPASTLNVGNSGTTTRRRTRKSTPTEWRRRSIVVSVSATQSIRRPDNPVDRVEERRTSYVQL